MYQIHYWQIDQLEPQVFEFESNEQGLKQLQNKIDFFAKPGRVFLLAAEPEDKIFIDDSWIFLAFRVIPMLSNHSKIFLQEYRSYEDAYAVALQMKEKSPLCYNGDQDIY